MWLAHGIEAEYIYISIRKALENGAEEGCSYSYNLEIVAGLYEQKKKKSQKKDDRNNNDLQVGCFITNNFPCADGETASWVNI